VQCTSLPSDSKASKWNVQGKLARWSAAAQRLVSTCCPVLSRQRDGRLARRRLRERGRGDDERTAPPAAAATSTVEAYIDKMLNYFVLG